MKVLEQTYVITNPFNEEMMLNSLKSQLSTLIFKELINNEKESIKVTFLMEVIEKQEQ